MRKLSILLPAMLMTGCATTTTTTAPSLADSQWRFTTIDGAAPIGEATLSFEGDRLSAHAGCNRLGGTWRSEGGALVTGPLMATKMFCEGKMDQERAVSELLSTGPAFTRDGDRLTLRSTSHWAELARRP